MNKIAVLIAALVAVLGIIFFKEGVHFVVNAMPEPWQCSLPGPPASCDGNIVVAAFLGLFLYSFVAVLAPIGFVISEIFVAITGRRLFFDEY